METIDDRARAAFGQSLAAERYAVACNELAWRARWSRLLAFEARELGCSDPARFHERNAEATEAELKRVTERGAAVWGNDVG